MEDRISVALRRFGTSGGIENRTAIDSSAKYKVIFKRNQISGRKLNIRANLNGT